MIRHMISSHSVAGRVLPYGRLFTRLFTFHGLDLTDQTDRQEPRYYDTFIASTLCRMRIPAPEGSLAAQLEEDEIRGMEVGVDPLDQMEDDLHIPPLQTEYPPSNDKPRFSTAHPSKSPPMPSYTQLPHFEQPRHYSPFPDPHYTPPPEHPSIHELQAKFHALCMDIHEMRDDITSLRGLVDESSDMQTLR